VPHGGQTSQGHFDATAGREFPEGYDDLEHIIKILVDVTMFINP